MSTPAASIRRSDKASRAAGFERLLNAGLQQVRDLSGELWTDHNLHDPGITVLEQLCFALSELAYHADFPVEDHLAGPDGHIPFEALALHPPREALSCRATTAADYRRLLLDRIDGLDDAHLDPARLQDPTALPGVFRLLLRPAAGARTSHVTLQRQALHAYLSERNLGEDVEPPPGMVSPGRGGRDEPAPGVVRDEPCHLVAEIELSGPREGAEVMAEIYHVVGRWIDRSPRRLARAEVLAQAQTLDRVYDGPRTQNGFLRGHDDTQGQTLYAADLARLIREEVQGVQEVVSLSLLAGSRADRRPTSSLRWSQANWALRLHVPGEPNQDDRVGLRVKLRRRQHEVVVSPEELWRRVQNLQAVDRAQRRRLHRDLQAEERAELPRGVFRAEPVRHHSVQHHFPALYGVGRHGLPASASPQRRAAVQQLQAYLLLFEQILANGEAQVRHLRDLFSVAGGQQSYWWPVLDREDVPGLENLLAQPHDGTTRQISEQLGAHFDRSSMRKSRLLDHLLALHGETITQNALRQFCGHLRSDELDRRLLENKARYLDHIVELGRDRAGAFDYGEPLWDNPSNCSGLARRVCLLLGFRHDHARSLTQALQRAEVGLVETSDAASRSIQPAQALRGEALNVVEGEAGGEPDATSLHDSLLRLRRGTARPDASLIRAGAGHDAFRVLQQPQQGAQPPPCDLVVGPDTRQYWWRLGTWSSRARAEQAARQLRRTFVELNDEYEGLHLVEHVLLRPLNPHSESHRQLGRPSDFYTLRLTAVMPDWTVRTHQKPFRRLAEETLRLNAPAHLEVQALWLGYAEMVTFERVYLHWLERRRAWCRAGPQDDVAALVQELDAAACELIGLLPPGGPVT